VSTRRNIRPASYNLQFPGEKRLRRASAREGMFSFGTWHRLSFLGDGSAQQPWSAFYYFRCHVCVSAAEGAWRDVFSEWILIFRPQPVGRCAVFPHLLVPIIDRRQPHPLHALSTLTGRQRARLAQPTHSTLAHYCRDENSPICTRDSLFSIKPLKSFPQETRRHKK